MEGTYFRHEPGKFPELGIDADYLDQPFQPEKPSFNWHKLQQRALGSFAVALSVVAGYNAVNAPEKARIAATEISIQEVFPAADSANDDAVLLAVGGVGHLSAVYAARQLEPLTPYNRVWSLGYKDDDIAPELVAEKLIEKLRSEEITTISIFGLSNGGKLGVDLLANYVLPQMPDMKVRVLFLDSTPLDGDAIREQKRGDVQLLLKLIDVIPDAEYNLLFRGIGEMVVRRALYMDTALVDFGSGLPPLRTEQFNPEKFWHEAAGIVRYVLLNPDSASTELLATQFDYLLRTDTKVDLARLGELTDDAVVVHLHAADQKKDEYVRIDDTVARFRDAAEDAGLEFAAIPIDGMGHTMYNMSRKKFNQALIDDIWPQTLAAIETVEERKTRLLASTLITHELLLGSAKVQ